MPDMRYAPPPTLRPDSSAGLNSGTVRGTNERLILSLLVQHGASSRLELGRRSGLSAQTVSVIVRGLQRDGLVVPGAAQRGRVGPPTVPVALNPGGAVAVGLALCTDAVRSELVGLTGETMDRGQDVVGRADQPTLLDAIEAATMRAVSALPGGVRDRIAGIGLGVGGGACTLEDPKEVESRLARSTGLPVYIQDGPGAVAGAEMLIGAAREVGDFVYLHTRLDGAAPSLRLVMHNRVHMGTADPSESERDAVTSSDRIRNLLAFVTLDTVVVGGAGPRDDVMEALAADLPGLAIRRGAIAGDGVARSAAIFALTARHLLPS